MKDVIGKYHSLENNMIENKLIFILIIIIITIITIIIIFYIQIRIKCLRYRQSSIMILKSSWMNLYIVNSQIESSSFLYSYL